MNLFIAGINIPGTYIQKASDALDNLIHIYPGLNQGNRFEYNKPDIKSFILTHHSKTEIIGDRNYISENNDFILFYSGLPVDPSGKIKAHRAEELLNNFDKIRHDYEGQASVIRFNKKTNNVDILTDTVGMEQVYYYNKADELIISNSIFLIERTLNLLELDPVGVSYFLSIGWVASDYTLRKNIEVIQGAQHWIWNNEKKTLNKITYFDVSDIKIRTEEVLKKDNVKNLAEKMSKNFSAINDNFHIECPLTGGFDSRLIIAFLIKNNIDASYYTSGDQYSGDVYTASLIANRFRLNYRNYETRNDLLLENWDDFIYKFMLQYGGLASLWQLPDIIAHIGDNDQIGVRMTSMGSEAGRVTYGNYTSYGDNDDKEFMVEHLVKKVIKNQSNLVNLSAIEEGKNYLIDFINSNMEKNVSAKIIPELFYIKERVGRHHANNWNDQKFKTDYFDIFCSREFLTNALRIDPLNKVTNPLHYKLMRLLNIELMKIPFNSNGGVRKFGPQNLIVKMYSDKLKDLAKKRIKRIRANIIASKMMPKSNPQKNKTVVPVFNRTYWFESKLDNIRSLILDQHTSGLWMFLNRDKLEKTLLNKDGKSINNGNILKLYTITTLFYYDYLSKKS